ncbi:MAG: hypothetical protein KGI37_04185 [Alphaproteobacteria bacterium]|nr:hypothetical protein [Alphaproteobacteria bacterium]
MKVSNTENDTALFEGIDFAELEDRFGQDSARAILRTLEQFEGIPEFRVATLSCEDRMRNVMQAMKDNIRFQTRH